MKLKIDYNSNYFENDIEPTKGLGTKAFEIISELTPIVNVDLLIRNSEGRVLVSWREDDICGKGWHIPGGVIRYKETFEQRIKNTALNELGVEVDFNPIPIDINEIILNQSVRGHFISLLFECFPRKEIKANNKTSYDIGDLHWYNCSDDVDLVIGQKDIYTKYLKG